MAGMNEFTDQGRESRVVLRADAATRFSGGVSTERDASLIYEVARVGPQAVPTYSGRRRPAMRPKTGCLCRLSSLERNVPKMTAQQIGVSAGGEPWLGSSLILLP